MTVDYSQLIQTYYSDVTYLVDILQKLTGTYTALVGSADGFNRIALAKKGDIEDAIDRAEALGKIIDNVIDTLETQVSLYMNYARIKNEFIMNNLPHNEMIKSDIEHHIKHEHHEHHED
jgi:hypothetical protein